MNKWMGMGPILEAISSGGCVACIGASQRTHYVDLEIAEGVLEVLATARDITVIHAGEIAFDSNIIASAAEWLGIPHHLVGPASFSERTYPYRRDPNFLEGCDALLVFSDPTRPAIDTDRPVVEAAAELGIPTFDIPRLWDKCMRRDR